MKVGLIGYGYWGPNLLRNLHETNGVEVKRCIDLNSERRAAASKRYPSVEVSADAEEILSDAQINAVVLATPVFTHHALAKRALEAGKHVFVEKPMTRTVKEAEELTVLAERKGLTLMVDHTYVIWDLAAHDLSILTYLIPDKPQSVSAEGADHIQPGLADVAYLTLHFANHFIAHFHVNWLSPVKVRQSLIGGSRRMLVYDDMELSEKVRVYDRGIQVKSQEGIYKALVDYRMGDVWSPKLDFREALSLECEHFVDCVRARTTPCSDGESGLQVVKILEAASTSLANGGRRVKV